MRHVYETTARFAQTDARGIVLDANFGTIEDEAPETVRGVVQQTFD